MIRCECGEKIKGANSITMVEDIISTITECQKCKRRIHRTFSLSMYSFHKNGELEKLRLIKKD